MTTTETRPARNGVDVPTLFATLDAVKANPAMARFEFRVDNRWVSGTHSQGRINGFHGALQENERDHTWIYDVDHPAVLVGGDNGPTPAEVLLHALLGCLTAGIANIAAARGVTLTRVESTVKGDIDLLGLLGISDEVRNGYEQISVEFTIEGDAPPEKLQQIVEQSKARSAVLDVITNGVPVNVEVQAG
jgi:uncharacterized OsmC-like protein